MSEEFLPPSIDPAQRKTITGTIQFIIDKLVKEEMDDMLPVQVVGVSARNKNRVSVQILVDMINTAGQRVPRAQVASVPILQLGGGGFVLSFPVSSGDLGWIKATDVDISLFLQQLSQSPPNTKIMHKFDSAVFVPDTMMSGVTIASGDNGSVVLQNKAGTIKVALSSSTVTVIAPTAVNVTAPTVTVNGNLVVNGNISQVSGAGATAQFSGSVTATGEVTGNGKNLSTHVHSGVQTGSGDTGPPV